jgi:hypothetical protein
MRERRGENLELYNPTNYIKRETREGEGGVNLSLMCEYDELMTRSHSLQKNKNLKLYLLYIQVYQ